METYIRKGHYGWQATTNVDLDDKRVLSFTTMKRSNGQLTTTVQCMSRQEGSKFLSYVMFQDWNCRVISEVVRCTEKSVTNQHQYALSLLEELKSQCLAHYDLTTCEVA
jgi:hypothetical protein